MMLQEHQGMAPSSLSVGFLLCAVNHSTRSMGCVAVKGRKGLNWVKQKHARQAFAGKAAVDQRLALDRPLPPARALYFLLQ